MATPSPAQQPKTFKSIAVARSSNIPWLGLTRAMAQFQRVEALLATETDHPRLAAFLPQNLLPWLWNYLKGVLHAKFRPYPGYPLDGSAGVFRMHAKDRGPVIKLSIAGDWGTGTLESLKVAQGMSDFEPDYTVHLGDVYYVGDEREVKENFLGVKVKLSSFAPVRFPQGAVGTLALLGNHEMYGGGKPYFQDMLAKCHVDEGVPQTASFWCLETDHWRVVGLDTGYNSVGTPILGSLPGIKKIPLFGANCALEGQLIEWLARNVKPQERKKPTILLSHHQYFTAFGDESFARPGEQLKEFFGGPDVIWIWGHEHRLAVYEKHSPDGNITCYGRCLGHGGMPVECSAPKPGANAKVLFYDQRCNYRINDHGAKAGWNGFVNLTMEGERLTLDYLDLERRSLFVEKFIGHADGSLEHLL